MWDIHEIVRALLILIAVKHVIGIKWPWEICDCCGKRADLHTRIGG